MFLFLQCRNAKQNEVAATIDGKDLLLQDIDNSIQNSLYEYLHAIYYVRKIALEESIANKVLSLESDKQKITIDSLVSSGIRLLEKKTPVEKFIKENALHNGIADEKDPFHLYSLTSARGQEILDKEYHRYLKQQYLKELMSRYDIKRQLVAPASPKIDMAGVKFTSQGNASSKITVWILSDFTCSACKEKEPIFKRLFEKYKDRVHFQFTHSTPGIHKAILLSDCATDRYWQARQYLYDNPLSDSTSLTKAFAALKLNPLTCTSCMNNPNLSLQLSASLKKLADLKLTATPTVLVNNRLYFGPITFESLSDYLDTQITD